MMNSEQSSRRRLLFGLCASAAVPMTIGFPLTTAFSNETGRPAPQWDILEWLNADGGNVGRLRGKVIVIDFFQLWCPGCNEFSGPLMQSWQEKYSSAVASGDLVLVKIHTVFEGHNYQTVRKLKSYIKEKKITIPVGVDRHAEGERIPTMT